MGKEIETTGLVSIPIGFDDEVQNLLCFYGHIQQLVFGFLCSKWTRFGRSRFSNVFASTGMVVVAPDYFGMNGWGEGSI